jgi:hypothetical protein
VRRLPAAATPVALALAGVAAGPAAAGTVMTLPCNVSAGVERTVPIRGAGFTPGQLVRLSYTSPRLSAPSFATAVQADAAGNFVTTAFPAPFVSTRKTEQVFGLVAEDPVDPARNATTTFRQVRFGVSVVPSRTRPNRKVRYTARGFPVGRDVYIHYRFRGRTRRTVKLGTATSPCGKRSRRMRLLPTRRRFGTWQVYIDQRPTYSRRTTPQASGEIFIRRFD